MFLRTRLDVPSIKTSLFKAKQDLQDKLLLGGDSGTPEKDSSNPHLKRIISQKAFQFGAESGVSAEFILGQAAEQMAGGTREITEVVVAVEGCLSPQIH